MISTRDEKLLNARKDDPTRTLESLGKEFGITRERVRQIFKQYKVPTRHITPSVQVFCNYCSETTTRNLSKQNALIERGSKLVSFCDDVCRQLSIRKTFACDNCGTKEITYRESQLRRNARNREQINSKTDDGYHFCSKRCQGKWLARTVGFGSDSRK